jgi:uncharacterized protein YndB with AHSA1/START domain
MNKSLVANTSVEIEAAVSDVWEALTDPKLIKQYMFGTDVVSNWEEGSSIVWQGEWEGKRYEDKGVILQLKPEKRLQYSHFSPLSGDADIPENYHTVTIELEPNGQQTTVSLAQDGIEDEDERKHSEKNWHMMLEGLQKLLED